MTLVDTSIWIDHLRRGNFRLADLLGEGHVLCHQFVIGEMDVPDALWAESGGFPEGLLSDMRHILNLKGFIHIPKK